MESAKLLRILETGLTPFAQAEGGVVQVAADPDHVLELLAGASPRQWRMILSYGGEEAVDPVESPGVVTWNLQTTIQAAKGLALPSGASTYKETAAGRDPLLALAALVSRWIRGTSGTTDEIHKRGFRHISSQWLVIEDLPTRQIMLTHSATVLLDKPIEVPLSF